MIMAGVDLFGWQAMRAAEAAVAEAHLRRAQAVRKARFAPHGERRDRERRLAEATTAALKAEAELVALKREADL
ncbi:hypothetical protein [Brevundimonas aurantiaca]|uniref:hypothetical protein n=1 Tax=Brevundimonas aurantiaca TaxID=74316 RepID=UPI002FDD8285